MKIEPLETRIAPAAVFTFTDVDGDRVTITTSKGTDADLAALDVLEFNTAADVPRQLQSIDLSRNPVFAGTDLTVTATRLGPGGDGVTAVGLIDATASIGAGTSLDLGKVTIDGDLGRIVAGTASEGTAVKTLDVRSLGLLGVSTQAAGGDLISTLTGKAGALIVRTDVVSASLSVDGAGSLKIGGSLLAGRISLGLPKIGTIFVGGDMVGGTGVDSGSISAGEVGSFVLKGSLIGGSGIASGRFFPGKVGSIFIGGDLVAGSQIDSGRIENNGAPVGSIVLRGSILSDNLSNAAASGNLAVGNVGTVFIGGSIVSKLAGAGSLNVGTAKAITINGSLDGGRVTAAEVGSLIIRGSMIGGLTDESGSVKTQGTKNVLIGGNLIAGGGERSGLLDLSTDSSTKVIVRGSLIANSISGENSAGIFSDGIGSIFIGGDLIGGADGTATLNGGVAGSIFVAGVVQGGTGVNSAQIDMNSIGKLRTGAIIGGSGSEAGSVSTTKIGSLLVVGDVIGGSGNALSGGIFVGGDVDAVDIRGNIVGGTADLIVAVPNATGGGQIEITGKVKTFTLGGDLRGGTGDGSGIVAIGGDIGAVTVGGRIIGNSFAAGSTGGGRFFSGGKIGAFTLGGDLVGDGTDSGKILANAGFGTLRIIGDVIGGEGDRSGVVDGDGGGDAFLRSLFIGGSIRGGEGVDSAFLDLENDGTTGAGIVIRGSLIGGAGAGSGRIFAGEAFANVTIDGSVIGGGGPDSGLIDLDNENSVAIKSVLVRGDIRGGSGVDSGRVEVDGDSLPVGSVVVGGTIFGGTADRAGTLFMDGPVKSVLIGGSLRGGVGVLAGGLEAQDSVDRLTIRGELRGGAVVQSGGLKLASVQTLDIGGAISGGSYPEPMITAQGIGTFAVGGSIRGDGNFPLRIESRVDSAGPLPHVAFGKITVGGSVTGTIIHGGFTTLDGLFDSDAQIGAVAVGGDWIASSLVAGVRNLGIDGVVGGSGQNADNIDFGDGNDIFTASPGDDPNIFSTIASITIGGRIRGTATPGTDHFGFVAQEIKAFKLAGETLTLALGRSNDNVLVSATNDVRVREI